MGAAPGWVRAHPPSSSAPGDADLRPALLERGEAALRRGDASAALDAFERAAMMLHSADAEMGIVRTMLLQGGYRQALAFAAHAAGAHREAPAACALYAWMLAAGGQGAFAMRALADSAARSNSDPLLGLTRRALQQQMPIAPQALLSSPHRAAPYSVMFGDDQLPTSMRGLGSGALVEGGQVALVPFAIAPGPGDALWLRDGLGRTVRVDLESTAPSLGIALLRPRAQVQTRNLAPLAGTDPFAGTSGSVVAFAPATDGEASLPWMFDGFLGPADGGTSEFRRLLFDLPAACGGAVWDAYGQLAGIACAERGRRWVPASVLRNVFGAVLNSRQTEPPRARSLPDEQYERSLTQVVQLLAAEATGD
jgi:hypothetical protein